MTRDYAAILKRGKDNAIPSGTLADALGFRSVRALRSDIARSRADGQIICSTTKGNGGYYLPGNREEIREFLLSMESRGKNTFRAIQAARDALKPIPGQMGIDDFLQAGEKDRSDE